MVVVRTNYIRSSITLIQKIPNNPPLLESKSLGEFPVLKIFTISIGGELETTGIHRNKYLSAALALKYIDNLWSHVIEDFWNVWAKVRRSSY